MRTAYFLAGRAVAATAKEKPVLPPGNAAENSLHEDLMPRRDSELDRLWPAIATVAGLLWHDGVVVGRTVHQLVWPSRDA